MLVKLSGQAFIGCLISPSVCASNECFILFMYLMSFGDFASKVIFVSGRVVVASPFAVVLIGKKAVLNMQAHKWIPF